MKLIARIIKRNNVHARVNVWQDGGLAGTLVVDNAVADEVVVALNMATAEPDLQEQRDALLAACKEALRLEKDSLRRDQKGWIYGDMKAAIAKAEGTE